MSKGTKGLLIGILVILVLLALSYGYSTYRVENTNKNAINNDIVNENIENVENEVEAEENEVVNEPVIQNTEPEENVVEEEKNTQEPEKEEKKNNKTESAADKRAKAIALVKQEWGDTDGVYFSNMGMNSEGNYIVSVNDKGSTKTLAFFVVDINSGTVTKQ